MAIRDLDSRNGTYLGGARVDRAVIRPGTRLTVGTTTLEVRSSDSRPGFSRLIGRSPALRKAIATARRAARSDCRILILGETGTGKELLARAIHDSSARA
ncbi:MAG: sigma 54-interacting transcriptional regulator, partial [Deltaproteobacteria bacterium]|nr:sigma 54-interacting transcriptional regulator [Deltaproteobacteria bacterium]